MLGDKEITFVYIFLSDLHIIHEHCNKYMGHNDSTGSQALKTVYS